jgi:hypothetical protein
MPDKTQIEGGAYPGIPPREPPDLSADQQDAYNKRFHADRTRTRASFGLGPLTAHPEDPHAARDSENVPYDTYGTTAGKRMIRKDAGPFYDQWNREGSRRNEWSEPRPAVSNAQELTDKLQKLTNLPNPYDSRKPPYATPTTVGEMANVQNKVDHYQLLQSHPVDEAGFREGFQLNQDYEHLKELFRHISPNDVTTLAQWDKEGLLSLNNVKNLSNDTLRTYTDIKNTLLDIAQRGGNLAGNNVKEPTDNTSIVGPLAEGAASLLMGAAVPAQRGPAFLGGLKAASDVASALADKSIDTNRIVEALNKTAVRNRQQLFTAINSLSGKNYDVSDEQRANAATYGHQNEQVEREDGGTGIGETGNANHAKMLEVGVDQNLPIYAKPSQPAAPAKAQSPGQVEPTVPITQPATTTSSVEPGSASEAAQQQKWFPKELREGGELRSLKGAGELVRRDIGRMAQEDWNQWAGPLWRATQGLFAPSNQRPPLATQGLGGFGAQTITPSPTPTPTATPVPTATPAPTPNLSQAPAQPTGLTGRLRTIAPAAEAVRSQFAPFLPRLPLERLNEPPAPKDYPPLNIPPTTSTRIPTQEEINQMAEGQTFPWHDGNTYVKTA